VIEKLIEIIEQIRLDEITCNALYPCPKDQDCTTCPLYTEKNKQKLIQELKNANQTE